MHPKRRPVFHTRYAGASVEPFMKGAVSAVLKTMKGEPLSDVELLGLCSKANPALLTFTQKAGKCPGLEGRNPMLGLIQGGPQGDLEETEYLEISTSTPISAEFVDNKVRLAR